MASQLKISRWTWMHHVFLLSVTWHKGTHVVSPPWENVFCIWGIFHSQFNKILLSMQIIKACFVMDKCTDLASLNLASYLLWSIWTHFHACIFSALARIQVHSSSALVLNGQWVTWILPLPVLTRSRWHHPFRQPLGSAFLHTLLQRFSTVRLQWLI